ncbi:hypothetical protein CLOM_g10582 [Closterium sp. NIES-68]|nr:hypothetical protein CLOM_g10582 [Closterium sp. NIES-68]GJP78826.1 hypothetical protein CLOP_g9094 [Closterium sp. NIES-67]
MVVSSPVGFELLGCFNVSAEFERDGERIGQPKGHVAVVSIPRSRVPAGGGPISLTSPVGSGDSIEDANNPSAAPGGLDGGGTALALLFVTKAGFTKATSGTAFAINDMGRFRMKFINQGKFSFEVRGEGPGGNTLVLCSVSSGQVAHDVRSLAQFISDIKIGKAPGMPHKCVACGLKDTAELDKKRKQEEALKEKEAKRQRMEEEKKVRDEQKKRDKEEKEARQKQEKAMKELQKKLKETEKDRDDMNRIRETLSKELKERGEIIRELQQQVKEKVAAAAREEAKRREEEARRVREESAAREAELRRAMEEEFRVKRDEEQRLRQAADMQRWAREQQKAKEVEEMRKKLQEEEGKRMFEAMSHREEMAKMKAEVERAYQYQQQQQQQQGQQADSFGPPPPPPPKDVPAEVLARYSSLLRDREARMRAAFAAMAGEIRRAEGELKKKRTEEERRRKAEEAKRSKAETARQKREEAMSAERRREEEERRHAQAEETRKREEERKRMEEVEKARRVQEEARRKAMAEESALAAKQKWLEDQLRLRQAAAPMTYEQYENRLRQIKNSAGSANVPLHFWDIPWPPEGNCLFLSPTDDPGLKKRKFKDALLFWHADKFVAFCGSRLVEDHKQVILKKVARLSQEVVEARNNL